MAGQAGKALKKAGAPKELSERMARWKRERDTTGVDWTKVDGISLRMALHALLAEGVAVMLAPAAGGTGVMLKVYEEGNSHAEFAMTAEDLNLLLEGLAETFGSSAEDLAAIFGRASG